MKAAVWEWCVATLVVVGLVGSVSYVAFTGGGDETSEVEAAVPPPTSKVEVEADVLSPPKARSIKVKMYKTYTHRSGSKVLHNLRMENPEEGRATLFAVLAHIMRKCGSSCEELVPTAKIEKGYLMEIEPYEGVFVNMNVGPMEPSVPIKAWKRVDGVDTLVSWREKIPIGVQDSFFVEEGRFFSGKKVRRKLEEGIDAKAYPMEIAELAGAYLQLRHGRPNWGKDDMYIGIGRWVPLFQYTVIQSIAAVYGIDLRYEIVPMPTRQ